jgi:hypothetical protein
MHGLADSPEKLSAFVLALLTELSAREKAMRLADKDASTAHDAMWAMDMATIMDGPTRTAFGFHRKAASDAIWKIHERLRALPATEPAQPEEET